MYSFFVIHQGHVATDRQYLDSWNNAIYIPNRDTVLSNGHLTSWTFYARRGGDIKFQVSFYYRIENPTPKRNNFDGLRSLSGDTILCHDSLQFLSRVIGSNLTESYAIG